MTSRFELRPTSPDVNSKNVVLGVGRHLLGRAESCGLVVNHESVSAVHAVLEVTQDKAVIYDMNSTNGTYVNDAKVIVKDVYPGNFLRLADVEFELLETEEAPLPELPFDDRSLPDAAPQTFHQSVPTIVHPPKEALLPGGGNLDLEVVILFNDKVFSTDHLKASRSTYGIRGLPTDATKNGEHPFVDLREGVVVHMLPGFEVFHLSDNKINTGRIGSTLELQEKDLVRFQHGSLQIFIRNLPSGNGPGVKTENAGPGKMKNLILFIVAMALLAFAFYKRDIFYPKKEILNDTKIIDQHGNEVPGPTPEPQNQPVN